MKKIVFAMLAMVCIVNAQTVTESGNWGVTVVYKNILDWSPFTSDSLATARSDRFDLTGSDSVAFFNYSISSNGSAKYLGVLEVSNNPDDGYDSIGVAADTTNVKLEAFNYIGTVKTNGALHGRIKVVGNAYAAASATQNRADTQANIYMAIYRRAKQ